MPPARTAQNSLRQIEQPRALAHLQRASLVRSRDHRSDHAVLLDREIHWMYNKSRLQPWRKHNGSYLELVSAPREPSQPSTASEAIEQALSELAEFFPATKERSLKKPRWSRKSAPPSACRPGSTHRAPARSRRGPIASWPATGSPPAGPRRWKAPPAPAISPPKHSAPAKSRTARFLAPDLKPRGLMRFLASD